MQIHELNTIGHKPVDTDYIAIDTGFDTAKISAPKLIEPKINRPIDEHNQYDDGAAGQILRSKGDGSTEWVDVGQPTDEQTEEAINKWLNDHPEATTTVTDGSLTEEKFSNALKIKAIKDYVTPEMYGAVGDGVTDDSLAVQNALDEAVTNGKCLAIVNRYKIKNVSINKTSELREPTFIVGVGGSLISDSGTMIKAVNSAVSDVYFENVSFIGDSSSVAVDCTNLYRVHFTNCEFKGFGHCLYTSGIMQSVIVNGCTFTNITQSCIEYAQGFALYISECIAEVSPNGKFLVANGYSHNLTVRDNCIEGFTNVIPIYLSACEKVLIQANYFEANMLGDIEIKTDASTLNCVTICDNLSTGVSNPSIAMMSWGGQILQSCQSFGNCSSGGAINDMSNVIGDANMVLYAYNNYTNANAENINPKVIIDPFRGKQARNYGKLSYEEITRNHRTFAVELVGFAGEATLFSVDAPYSSRGIWFAVLNITGILGGTGYVAARYVVDQNGTVTPLYHTVDITNLISVASDSVKFTRESEYVSSFQFSVELYGEVVSLTLEGTKIYSRGY